MTATDFFKVYSSDTTVTLDVAPYADTYTAVTVLQTKLLTPAVGCHVMRGWDGFEIIPCMTGSTNQEMRMEVWLWYRISDPTADPDYPNAMYLPILSWTWATNASLLASTYVGVASNYIPATMQLCDTVLAHNATTWGTFQEKFYTEGLSNVEEYSPTGDIPGLVKVPWCNDAHAIHVHLYEPDAGTQQNYGQALMRFTKLPGAGTKHHGAKPGA